ncbi:NifB/NifX family molybdenum-iron cluster-binding protein [Trichloromonas sp.]|uniref:NifB/NifX family molybdenum-iron cluster-binding protein n=1 Tax=Trichloromonas sp. TaxID=3069249 RepID=UPI002A3E7FC7|nr:NifB/NifX family molybdenum-iron cluster-binding protein [Trichloromonas sp.]
MNNVEVIAIPSMYPGGLEANRSGHFGRCDLFTLVTMSNGEVQSVRTVPNVEHAEGGCLVPVQILQQAGATSLVVAGIGMRPRIGFAQAGIEVLVGPGTTVGEVIAAYQNNQVRPIADSDLCGGGGH